MAAPQGENAPTHSDDRRAPTEAWRRYTVAINRKLPTALSRSLAAQRAMLRRIH